jgi:hypothetical protein
VDPRRADPTNLIAQERLQPGRPSPAFLVAVAVVALGFLGLAIGLGVAPREPTAAEQAAAASPAGLLDTFGLEGARLASAAFGAAAVAATAFLARHLLHSDAAGVFAGLMLAADPSLLVASRLGLPHPIALAGLATAVACTLTLGTLGPWLGSGALLVAAAADPRSLLWGIPLGLMAMLRGHIYAAPRHLVTALLQGLAIPAVGAGLHLLATGGRLAEPACLGLPAFPALGLAIAPDMGSGIVAVRNPATWFGGLGAVALLGGAALVGMARQFRVARLPGRLQLRIAAPLPAMHARALWLLALAVLAPFPDAWLIVAAVGLAAGVLALSEDAPGFGVAVAAVLAVFAIVALARVWPFLTGAAPLDGVLGFLPWTRAVACA